MPEYLPFEIEENNSPVWLVRNQYTGAFYNFHHYDSAHGRIYPKPAKFNDRQAAIALCSLLNARSNQVSKYAGVCR